MNAMVISQSLSPPRDIRTRVELHDACVQHGDGAKGSVSEVHDEVRSSRILLIQKTLTC
jgi:hypothetical protein